MADFIPPSHNMTSPFADMRGHHIAVRTPDLETAKRWYVEKLDFRVVAESVVQAASAESCAARYSQIFYSRYEEKLSMHPSPLHTQRIDDGA